MPQICEMCRGEKPLRPLTDSCPCTERILEDGSVQIVKPAAKCPACAGAGWICTRCKGRGVFAYPHADEARIDYRVRSACLESIAVRKTR